MTRLPMRSRISSRIALSAITPLLRCSAPQSARIRSAPEPVTITHEIIMLSATADVLTYLIYLFCQNGMTVVAATEVSQKPRGMEVGLALDDTGLMRGSKIADPRGPCSI